MLLKTWVRVQVQEVPSEYMASFNTPFPELHKRSVWEGFVSRIIFTILEIHLVNVEFSQVQHTI